MCGWRHDFFPKGGLGGLCGFDIGGGERNRLELEFGGEVEYEDSVLERDFAIGADDEVFVLFAEFFKGRRQGLFGDVLAVDLVLAAFSDGKDQGFFGTRLRAFSGG